MANQVHLFDNEIFDGRNKAYGAYSLRRLYGNNVLFAFIIASTIISLALVSPVIYNTWFAGEKEEEITQTVVVDMENIQTEIEEPEVKIDQPLPQVATVKSLPPEIKPDAEVPKEELPPTDDDLKDKNPGSENVDGEKGSSVTTPSQPQPKEEPKVVAPEIVTWADQMPTFPGGPSEFIKYLQRHIEYPERAKSEEKQGTVRVSFVVNLDGSISDIKILKPIGFGLDEEALRVFKKMPKWNPGSKKGVGNVPVRMVYPVVFQLEIEE